MSSNRIAMIALSAAAASMLLTACNDDNVGTPAADGQNFSSAAKPAGDASSTIGRYTKDAPGAQFFASVLTGDNEVPVEGKPAVGDKDGRSAALMRIQGDEVSFAFAWTGIGTPTMAHLHQGPRGANGDVKIPFFTEKLEDGSKFVYGTAKVSDSELLKDIKAHPEEFYFNLHTAEFPGGAVRGQVFTLPGSVNLAATISDSALRSVDQGTQIYACTKQADGSFVFTQDNVDATLQGNIAHSFAKRGPAGPPQWIAPDGSSVTATAINKLANGSDNIPELILTATQTGKPKGLLSKTQTVLRLNTVGGTAPAGTCNPSTQPSASVPYTADYLFLATQ